MSSIAAFTSNHSNCVSRDMCVAGVSNFSNYATIGAIDQALKVPMGSQLNILSAMSAGNIYADFTAVNIPTLAPGALKLTGFNTMGQAAPAGAYMSFSSAYGR